jgi:NADPH-dependent 2,4-dienoyl-CoA reductase/sulfur reductase-like enzyme/nitrite reductase/ring-hydroxylating ferredoxin subunit
MAEQPSDKGPDLTQGIALSDIPESGLVAGHVGEDAVLLARCGEEFFAVGASCTHYHGPLAEGLRDGDMVLCPWHHARFSLRSGEAVRAPAFDALGCWNVERRGDKIFVTGKKQAAARRAIAAGAARPSRIVIVGGGAAGFAAAEMLRREQFQGQITLLSDDAAPPVDRPNLSKDYLAGKAPEDWVPLRPESWYGDNEIGLRLDAKVAALDARAAEVALGNGERVPYDRLLLATGAEPVRLPLPGGEQAHVLRSLADCRAIIAAAAGARQAVVIGASFIGLEVAASLRARGLAVHVVAPERRPLEKVFGPELGDFVRMLHEEQGVVFHLQDTVATIEGKRARLKSGTVLDADLVVVGVGVRPRVELAEKAGLMLDRGVTVDKYLATSAPNVFAAGDIARWPGGPAGESMRVEHWVVAERQGQTAARNMLGAHETFADVPFFWSQHYDVPINYVGHAESWDEIRIEGEPRQRNCVARYVKDGQVRAVASIYRDVESLQAELELARA